MAGTTDPQHALVVDAGGQPLSPCSIEKAQRLVARRLANVLVEHPLTIMLERRIELPQLEPRPVADRPDFAGQKLLAHICCAPCSTYTIRRLREISFDVTGFWYNPNVHPFQEHERRRASLEQYAETIDLPVIWAPGYDMPAFFRRVAGHEQFRERCAICYQMRLAETARQARLQGFAAFTTTLLISPFQNQDQLRELGEDLARTEGVRFYFENFRQGWAERTRTAKELDLYLQPYCGCLYSEWERYRDQT